MGLVAFITVTVALLLLLAYDYLSKTIELNHIKLQFASADSLNILHLQTEQSSDTLRDNITKLPSWKIIEDRLHQNIKESKRYQFTLALMFISLDNFKVITDALGDEIGNTLLQETATRLETCIRKADSIGRFAKDTFMVILTQLSKPETAAIVAQRMLQALQEPFRIKGHELFVTANIGIALYPSDGDDVTALLRSCEQALYLAKENGGHAYQFCQQDVYYKSRRTLMLYTNLSQESIFKEFIPSYQPIVDVQSESILSMEMAFHWCHEEQGEIQSSEIIAVAEKQGKLNMITEWQLKQACTQFLYWQQIGFKPTYICVPVLMEQLIHSHFIYQLSSLMQAAQFDPTHLMLEVKGNSMRLSSEAIEKAFHILTYMGVKIAINDFGSGSFPLRYLKNLEVHYLKLDRALTDDIDNNPQAQILLKSILLLAENMAVTIIAQGIEFEQQVIALKKLGCHVMQGYFVGAPLSEIQVREKMIE